MKTLLALTMVVSCTWFPKGSVIYKLGVDAECDEYKTEAARERCRARRDDDGDNDDE